MTTYLGEFRFRVSGCESEEDFDLHIDQVLEHLYDDDRVREPDYTASLAERTVEFSLSVSSDDEVDAFTLLHSALRAAIHAAGGGTPGWEDHFRVVQSSVRPDELVDA